ncbi:hypothetical protein HNR01_003009 [Methylorubrum rhodesianum]|nr:hypothetical protein [Methylorubrum rhodesianum]
MEAVAAHALPGHLPRDREELRDLRLRAVEGGVEAGDLRQVGELLPDDADRLQVVRLVQRRQRHQPFQGVEHRLVHPHGRRVGETPMHDAVAHGGEPVSAAMAPQPLGHGEKRLLVPVAPTRHGRAILGDDQAVAVTDHQVRASAQALEQPAEDPP